MSLAHDLSPTFWTRFAQENLRRTPAHFRGAVPTPIASVSDVFRSLRTFDERLQHGGPGPGLYLDALTLEGPVRSAVESGSPLLPAASDDDLPSYLRRISELLDENDYSLLVTDLQATDPGIWARTTAFLRGLYAAAGLPLGGASLQLIAGRYQRSAFALHKDSQDVFTFVSHGRRRYYLWPYETFSGAVRADKRAEPVSQEEIAHVRYEDHLASAIVYDAEPGDLLYWPASYWHAVEGDGAPSATLSLGLFYHRLPEEVLELFKATLTALPAETSPEPAAARAGDGACDRIEPSLRAVNAGLDALRSPRAQDRMRAALGAWSERYGFRFAPNEVAER